MNTRCSQKLGVTIAARGAGNNDNCADNVNAGSDLPFGKNVDESIDVDLFRNTD